jgi:hypothetical protein
MDVTAVETWLDLAVVLIALAAVIAGGLALRQMLRETAPQAPEPATAEVPVSAPVPRQSAIDAPQAKADQASPSVPSPAAPAEIPAPPLPEELPYPKKAHPLRSFWQRVFSPRIHVREDRNVILSTERRIPKPPKQIVPPKLVAKSLQLQTPQTLLLTLRNDGYTLFYQRFETGPNNELNVCYEPPETSVKLIMDEYQQGDYLAFSMSGSHVISQTFQFFLIYGDMDGHLYRQEIAGIGKDFPLLGTPEQLS